MSRGAVQQYDFEVKDIAIAMRRVVGIEEEKPVGTRQRPGFTAYVLWPSFVFGALIMMAVFGFGLMVMTPLIALNGLDAVWLVAVWGFAMFTGALTTYSRACDLVDDWRDLQYSRKQFTFNDEPNDNGKMRVMASSEPNRYMLGKYTFRAGELQQIARLYVNERGDWVGKDKLVRDDIAQIVVNVTENYGDIVGDFRRFGWLDDKNYWTRSGRAAIKQRAYPTG